MDDRKEFMSETRILEKLSENQINYFSLTLFKNYRPVISHCNHIQWFDLYKEQYDSERPPPAQKYIFCSALRLLIWDFGEIDKETRAFIQKRNNIVEACENLTVLFRKNEYLTAITLGTKQKRSHLINFLNEDLDCLLLMEQNLFYKSV